MVINFIFEIACICAGILLAISTLDWLDGESNFFISIAEKLKPYNTIIGILTLGIGILYVIKIKCVVFAVIGILCGLLLIPQQLVKVPVIGNLLSKSSKTLLPFKVIIGDIALILGVLGLLNINPLC
jgi:hypothetical protein